MVKRAFISGSTQGIGYSIAKALLQEGAEVVINGRDASRLQQSVKNLQAAVPGGVVAGIAADFTDASAVQSLLSTLGAVDILVNNVGVFGLKPFTEISDDEWSRYFAVNVMSGVRLSRGYCPG